MKRLAQLAFALLVAGPGFKLRKAARAKPFDGTK
jgi:hypothetical protein